MKTENTQSDDDDAMETSKESEIPIPNKAKKGPIKGRSCKGTLYYSTALKSKGYKPLCVGIPRALPQVPDAVVVDTEMDASKEDRHLADFYYACAGYSVYLDRIREESSQTEQAELPVCVGGIELLVGKRIRKNTPVAAPVPAHVLHKEDGRKVPQTQRHNPSHSSSNVFLSRFSRNADLVASGVTKNICKVGNYIKGSLSDFLYPYRGRPK